MYSEAVLEHFQNPRNSGDLPDADATVRVENPACGDILHLALNISHGRITETRFRARGCVASIACGSRLTEMISGCTISEAHELSRQQLVDSLGGLPEASTHAGHLAMDALAGALRALGQG